jgi:hypothetical protein
VPKQQRHSRQAPKEHTRTKARGRSQFVSGTSREATSGHIGADPAGAHHAIVSLQNDVGNRALTSLIERGGMEHRPSVAVDREDTATRARPRLPPVNDESFGDDPVAGADEAVQQQWESMDQDVSELRRKLYEAQQNHGVWDANRAGWYLEADALAEQLHQMQSPDVIAGTRVSYDELRERIFDISIPANTKWEEVKDDTASELAEAAGGSGLADLYAYEHLAKAFELTRSRLEHIDGDVRMAGDIADLERVISTREHVWKGELRAARERALQVADMLDLVGDLKASGENADRMIPGWEERVMLESERLTMLASNAPDSGYQQAFIDLDARVLQERDKASSRGPIELGVLDKAELMARGGILAITDAMAETGKQAIDLAKIFAYNEYRKLGGESWEPELYSDMAEAAKGGAGTWDLLMAMPEGIIETPGRVWEAIENDDWETIGREAVNIYMLAKAAKQGVSGAKQIPAKLRQAAAQASKLVRLVRARIAARGIGAGMSQSAIEVVRHIAQKYNLEIRFRPVEKSVIRLRELGHPGKIVDLKMKTIKDIDVHLGASQTDIGKVGFFKPELPDGLLRMPKKQSAKIINRHDTRMHEWKTMQGKVQDLTSKGIARLENGVMIDGATGKAFTGDYDLFEIRRRWRDGREENLDYDSLKAEIRDALERDPVSTEHGGLPSWDVGAGEAEAFARLVKAHRPGGEPLMTFGPNGEVTWGWVDD